MRFDLHCPAAGEAPGVLIPDFRLIHPDAAHRCQDKCGCTVTNTLDLLTHIHQLRSENYEFCIFAFEREGSKRFQHNVANNINKIAGLSRSFTPKLADFDRNTKNAKNLTPSDECGFNIDFLSKTDVKLEFDNEGIFHGC